MDESKAKEKTGKAGAGTRKKRAAEETGKGKTETPISSTQFDQSTMLAPSASPNEGTDDVSISFPFMPIESILQNELFISFYSSKNTMSLSLLPIILYKMQ